MRRACPPSPAAAHLPHRPLGHELAAAAEVHGGLCVVASSVYLASTCVCVACLCFTSLLGAAQGWPGSEETVCGGCGVPCEGRGLAPPEAVGAFQNGSVFNHRRKDRPTFSFSCAFKTPVMRTLKPRGRERPGRQSLCRVCPLSLCQGISKRVPDIVSVHLPGLEVPSREAAARRCREGPCASA